MKMVIVSCQERAFMLAETIANLKASDWNGEVDVVFDLGSGRPSTDRIRATWKRALETPADVWCEDDIVFGQYFQHNLQAYRAETPGMYYTALYHPNFDASETWGCQAVTMSPDARNLVIGNWDETTTADLSMPRTVKKAGGTVGFHDPSLVQHIGESTYGGPRHWAKDFDFGWRHG